MTKYLLGHRAAYLYLSGNLLSPGSPEYTRNELALKWLKSINDRRDIKISEITLFAIMSEIYNEKLSPLQTQKYEDAFLNTAPVHLGHNLLVVNRQIFTIWAKIRFDSPRDGRPLPDVTGLEVATARYAECTYVAERTPTLEHLAPGLLDPWGDNLEDDKGTDTGEDEN